MTPVPPLAVCLCPLIAGLWHSSTQQSYLGDDRELIARTPEYFRAWKGLWHARGRDCLEIGVRRCRGSGGQLPLLPDLGQAWGTWIFTPNQATATPQLCFSLSHSSQRHRLYPSHPLNQQGGMGMLLEGTGGG